MKSRILTVRRGMMELRKAAIFGTGKAAEIAYNYCVQNTIEVLYFVDDYIAGEKNGQKVIRWNDFLQKQTEADALIAGRWQKGYLNSRVNLAVPLIFIDEKMSGITDNRYDIHHNIKNLAKFNNIHKGCRCFIIGNGPSLSVKDLDKLKNEITFASNKIYLSFEETSWRPTYLCVEDWLVAKQNYETLNSISLQKFIEKETLDYLTVRDAVVFEFIHSQDGPDFSYNMMNGICHGHSIVCSQIQMAYYMGISEIYLIGVDFSFEINVESAGKIFDNIDYYEYDGSSNHFHPDYRSKGELWAHPNLEAQYAFFDNVRKNVITDTFRIYNASRKTELDVFEMKDFDELF